MPAKPLSPGLNVLLVTSCLGDGESRSGRWKGSMYAVIETGGKQYKVQEGDVLNLELLNAGIGDLIEINKVLAVVKEGEFLVGKPHVEGAKAIVKVLEHGKDDKILVFKYKPKKNYRKIRGHRQPFTKVAVEKIEIQ